MMVITILLWAKPNIWVKKEDLFNVWNNKNITQEDFDRHSKLHELKDDDKELYNIGYSLEENYVHAKTLRDQYTNMCDLLNEWLNNEIDKYRRKSTLCRKNRMLFNYIESVWQEKQNIQVDDDRNWCTWKRPHYDCDVSLPIYADFSTKSRRNTIFSACFSLIIIVVLNYFIIFNFSKIKKLLYSKYDLMRFIRKYSEDSHPYGNKEDFSLTSDNKRDNILYLSMNSA
ncbi:variable surface protein [Plasmodium gonderi]|uniref:Variable surface protein n=1 Tax=Plasmodium gonderi TaxID=77519 RepID=A0A1Y1JPQ8_PLAGO|nr:variable surface protein [Plasmodium gonderi]GAW84461.1 variable surface protein [Plasmodium gonderi]